MTDDDRASIRRALLALDFYRKESLAIALHVGCNNTKGVMRHVEDLGADGGERALHAMYALTEIVGP